MPTIETKPKRRRKAGNPVIKAAVAVAKAIQDLNPEERQRAVKAALTALEEPVKEGETV